VNCRGYAWEYGKCGIWN